MGYVLMIEGSVPERIRRKAVNVASLNMLQIGNGWKKYQNLMGDFPI